MIRMRGDTGKPTFPYRVARDGREWLVLYGQEGVRGPVVAAVFDTEADAWAHAEAEGLARPPAPNTTDLL